METSIEGQPLAMLATVGLDHAQPPNWLFIKTADEVKSDTTSNSSSSSGISNPGQDHSRVSSASSSPRQQHVQPIVTQKPPLRYRHVPAASSSTTRTPPPSSCQQIDLKDIFEANGQSVNLDLLQKGAQQGALKASPYRAVTWQILLGILPTDNVQLWENTLRTNRQNYCLLRQVCLANGFIRRPMRSEDCNNNNNNNNTKENYEQIIKQDIRRAQPGIDFFQKQRVQLAMRNILYCYTCSSTVGYRQGMHEILAVVLFCVHCDQIKISHLVEHTSDPLAKRILPMFAREDNLEADAYQIFIKIMYRIQKWYINGPVAASDSAESSQQQHSNCPSLLRLNRIHDRLLKAQSPELHAHLQSLEIDPAVFGIRWLRLMFAYEFSLPEVMTIWDAIFATRDLHEMADFPFVDHIYVVLLLQIKNLLIGQDFSTTLCNLMKMPPSVDASMIVASSLKLYHAELALAMPDSGLNSPVMSTASLSDFFTGLWASGRKWRSKASTSNGRTNSRDHANQHAVPASPLRRNASLADILSGMFDLDQEQRRAQQDHEHASLVLSCKRGSKRLTYVERMLEKHLKARLNVDRADSLSMDDSDEAADQEEDDLDSHSLLIQVLHELRIINSDLIACLPDEEESCSSSTSTAS